MKRYIVVALNAGNQLLNPSEQPQGLFESDYEAEKSKQELYEKWKSSGEQYDPVYRVVCVILGK
jgi:hypothetical protein